MTPETEIPENDFLTPEEKAEEDHVNPKGYLTHKQEVFCREYITDFNGTQAAIRAGYAKEAANRQASRLLTKDHVRARVDQLIAERAETLEVTQGWVVKGLKKVAGRCLQEVRPFTDARGNQIKDENGNPLFVFDTRGANQALELLGKHTGAFKLADAGAGVTIINVTQKLGEKEISANPEPLTEEEEKELQALLLPKHEAPATPVVPATKEGESPK